MLLPRSLLTSEITLTPDQVQALLVGWKHGRCTLRLSLQSSGLEAWGTVEIQNVTDGEVLLHDQQSGSSYTLVFRDCEYRLARVGLGLLVELRGGAEESSPSMRLEPLVPPQPQLSQVPAALQ